MKAHWAYLRYVLRHKWYVFVECCKLGIPFRGVVHDLSKFRPSEWFAYAQWFYGKRLEVAKAAVDEPGPYRFGQRIHLSRFCGDERTYVVAAKSAYRLGLVPLEWKEACDFAWLHHQHRNEHHWQYWILVQDEDEDEVLPMPDEYRREMLADWRGAGRAQGKPDTRKWYLANRKKMELHLETERWIEAQLGVSGEGMNG